MTDRESTVVSESCEGRPGPLARLDARLADLRSDDTHRRVALGVAIVVGLAAATVHWVGLVVGGALVGLTRKSLPRALVAGAGFGVLVLVVFLVVHPLVSPDALVALAPLSYVTVGLAVLAPAWGALLRGAF